MIFKDIDPGRWSTPDIIRAAGSGLMTGYPDGMFRPEANLTREEMASIISRLLFRDGLFTDVLPGIMPAVILLHAGDWLGSGAFVSPNGHIITNAHVAGDKQTLTIIKDGQANTPAQVIAKSATHDLALIKANITSPAYLKIAGKDVQRGEHVGILGAPKGYPDSFTQGQVSHPDRFGDCFQTDAPINPGNSGGPAINERGELVGVSVSKVVATDTEGLAFCIHARYVREFLLQQGVIREEKNNPDSLSPHFARREFVCKCCGEFKVDPRLVELLEKLRAELGQPITVTSGYRCPAHNRAVGGAENSYHMQGKAADISVVKRSPFEVAKAAVKVGFGGIGTYTSGNNYFTHVDVGPERRWAE